MNYDTNDFPHQDYVTINKLNRDRVSLHPQLQTWSSASRHIHKKQQIKKKIKIHYTNGGIKSNPKHWHAISGISFPP